MKRRAAERKNMLALMVIGMVAAMILNEPIRRIPGSSFIPVLLGLMLVALIAAILLLACAEATEPKPKLIDACDLKYSELLAVNHPTSWSAIALALLRMHFDGILRIDKEGVVILEEGKTTKTPLESMLLNKIKARDAAPALIDLLRNTELNYKASESMLNIIKDLCERDIIRPCRSFAFFAMPLLSIVFFIGAEKLWLASVYGKSAGYLTLFMFFGAFVMFFGWQSYASKARMPWKSAIFDGTDQIIYRAENEKSSLRAFARMHDRLTGILLQDVRENDREVVEFVSQTCLAYQEEKKAEEARKAAQSDSGCSGCSSCSSCGGCGGCGGCGD